MGPFAPPSKCSRSGPGFDRTPSGLAQRHDGGLTKNSQWDLVRGSLKQHRATKDGIALENKFRPLGFFTHMQASLPPRGHSLVATAVSEKLCAARENAGCVARQRM